MPHFSPSILILELVQTDTGATLHAAGELDISSKAAFAQALPPVLTAFRSDAPHLDLSGLDYMDSAGLESLVWANSQLATGGGRLHLRVKSKSQPARVLRLGRFDKLMQIDFISF